MSAYNRMCRLAFAALMVLVVTCVCVGTAFAANATVWGAQTYTKNGTPATVTDLNLVYLQGAQGDTVYLTVKDGSNTIVQYLPHQLGEGADEGGEPIDVFSLKLENGLDEDKLKDGSYTVEVWTKRGGDQLFSGKVYGVWARLQKDGESAGTVLIGARTVADEGSSFTFAPPSIVRVDGVAYSKSSDSPEIEEYLAYYDYTFFDPDEANEAEVNYVDEDGNLLGTEKFPVVDGSGTYSIPATYDAPNGKRYRTLAFVDSVTATYPDQMAFTVQCAYVGGAAYVATIRFVDEDAAAPDNLIATDTVNVDGIYNYTVPRTIYKYEEADGEMRAVSYDLDDEQLWVLDVDADMDLVVNGAREIEVKYKKRSLDAGEVEVTFNQLDGRNDDNRGRMMGTQTATVTKDSPSATPADTIEIGGTTYVLASDASDCEYTYGSGKVPVVDVYYVPQGYSNNDAYEVTVNYVNYANGAVIRSEVVRSTSNPAVLTIDSPARFDRGSATYIRLDGQSGGLTHNFYSGMDTYTVYYRDSRDKLSDTVVIERIRVVAGGATSAEDDDAASSASTVTINPAVGYNVVGGTGNGTVVNDRGEDTNTERIADDETPSADAETTNTPSDEGGIIVGGIAAAVVLAIAALLWWFLVGRRKKDEDEAEAQGVGR